MIRELKDRVVGSTTGLFSHGPQPLEHTLDFRGDPGLLGPDSVSWRVIGDAAAFVGGIRALLVQTAHPEVVAGVDPVAAFATAGRGIRRCSSPSVPTSVASGRPVGTVRRMDVDDGSIDEGSLTLNVEALARYRDDPVRLEMAAKMLAKNYSGEDDPPLPHAALRSWHEQNRRAHRLVLARLDELRRTED